MAAAARNIEPWARRLRQLWIAADRPQRKRSHRKKKHPKPKTRKKKPSHANGVELTIITAAYIESLVFRGGITRIGLSLIGESPRRIHGWRTRNIGRTIIVDEGELFAETERVSAKWEKAKTFA